MRTTIDIPAGLGGAWVETALEGLTALAERDIVEGGVPALYTSGVRYERERGTEDWQLPSQVLGRGRGDCEDLAAWRAAELRVHGVDPGARAIVVRTGPRTLHALVERSDGVREDPSAALGMPTRDGVARPELVVGVEPGATWCLVRRRTRDGADLVSGDDVYSVLGSDDVSGELGVVNPLEVVARGARGLLDAFVPAAPGQSPPTGQAKRDAAAALAQASASRGIAPSPEEVLRLASDLARIVSAEKRRAVSEARRR